MAKSYNRTAHKAWKQRNKERNAARPLVGNRLSWQFRHNILKSLDAARTLVGNRLSWQFRHNILKSLDETLKELSNE